MARQIRRFGRLLLLLGPIVLLATLLLPTPKSATAAYTSPFWTNASPSPECLCACECEGPSEWGPEGVSNRTGELRVVLPVFDLPGKTQPFALSLLLRSYISGGTQFGSHVIPSYLTTVEMVIDVPGTPWGPNGNHALVRDPTGLVSNFNWSGTAYTATSCLENRTLSLPAGPGGTYRLTTKHGSYIDFNTDGMPATWTDTYGNTMTATHNASRQLTGITDWRGKSCTIATNGNGYITSIACPDGRTFTFGYSGDSLTTLTTPATTDQPSGITTTLAYDGSGRLSSIQDGRGNTIRSVAYVGATEQVSTVTIDGDVVSFSYASGRVDRTDRRGKVHRSHYTGQIITQTDMWVAGAASYVSTYGYYGDNRLAYVILPRQNRIDYTWSGAGDLTERRHKSSSTPGTSASDIVHTWGYNSSSFVTSYTDPLGNQTTYTRDAGGGATMVSMPTVTNPTTQTASRSNTFNAYGQLTQSTDEEGRVVSYTYVASGADVHLLAKVEVDPSGIDAETLYDYDAYWNVDSVTDALGGVTTRTYDTLRRIKQLDLPGGLGREKWEYDANGNVTKYERRNLDKDGVEDSSNPWFTTTYTYTVLNDLASVTEEISSSVTRTTTLDYDDEQNQIRATLPEGNKIKTDYDERGLVSKVTRGETTGLASEREYTYDANGNLVEEENGRNYDTTHTYDMFDRRTRSTNAQSHYTEWTLDKKGQATEIARKDSSNNVLLKQERFYDERGRLWKTEDLHKDPSATYSDAVTTITRYKTGHVSTVTDARSKVTTMTYDNAWRRTKITDHAGNFTEWTLDDNGNPTAWTIHDEDGASDVEHDYEATYDALGRRLTTVEIDRTNGANTYTTTNGYDSRSNLVWQVNAEGNPTRWTYDGLSRMRVKDVALAVGTPITNFTTYIRTQWGFDKNDRLTSHKDDAANETTWAYDALDRATTMTYPDSTTVAYTYDAEDNVTQTVDALGNDIDDTYDSLNRRTARTVTRASGVLDTTTETFTYDAADRLLTAEDDDYDVEFTYGVLGLGSNVYEEKQAYGTGTAYLKTVTKKYDAVGNKTSEVYPSSLALTYTWTDVNQVDTITDGTNTLADYAYAGLRRKQLVLGNNSQTHFTYGGFRGEVTTIDHQDNSGNSLLKLDYGYNKLHDRTFERYGSSGQPGDAFEYDKARRLTVAWMGSSTPSSPSGNTYVNKIQYGMDNDGNRTTVTVTPYGSSPVNTSYTDNNLNQYTAVGGVSRSHDGNGNVSDDGTYLYEYNYKNLICRVKLKSNSSTVAEYKYDALGRRVEKSVTGATYRYIFSCDQICSVYTSSGAWKQDYVYGANVDEVLLLQQADVLDWDGDNDTSELARSWYRPNALGSIMRIEESDRTEAVSYRYDPYGEVTITRGGTAQSSDPLGQYITYTGRWRDEESGLYEFRARSYRAANGRFETRDPLGYDPGVNVYEYASSRPSVLIDPFGLSPEPPKPEFDTSRKNRISFRCRGFCFCWDFDVHVLENYKYRGKEVRVTSTKRVGRYISYMGGLPLAAHMVVYRTNYSITYDVYSKWEADVVRYTGTVCYCFPMAINFTLKSRTKVGTKMVKKKEGSGTAEFNSPHAKLVTMVDGYTTEPADPKQISEAFYANQKAAIEKNEGAFTYPPPPAGPTISAAPPIDFGK